MKVSLGGVGRSRLRVQPEAGGGSADGIVGFPRARNRLRPAARWVRCHNQGWDIALASSRKAAASGVTPGDGPQQVHLVLLDNGRSKVLADPQGRAALHCIRCSACLNVCPVYERAGGHAYGSVYPGPIGAVLSPQLTGMGGHGDPSASLPFASTLCGACFDACPVRIDIPSMLVHLRSKAVDADRDAATVPGPEAAGMAAVAWLFRDPGGCARPNA